MTTLTMIKLLFVLCIYIEIIVSEGPYIHHIYLFREPVKVWKIFKKKKKVLKTLKSPK